MHILFLSDNFPPEGNAPATRTFEHAREWVRLGHRVTVITCAPNFPEGKVYAGYRNRLFAREDMAGIEVWRVKTYITANEGFMKRTLDYLSFMASGFTAGLFVRKPDVVVATSPQFFTACAGWLLAALRRKPFVFELRDLWPASITAVGAMQESRVTRSLERLELFLYRRADLIVSVTQSFKQDLTRRGIDPAKIHVVVNGVDLDQYSPRAKDAELVERHGLQGKFVAAYIGTHGMAHALETLVQAAELLRERRDIVFLFAGGGAAAETVKALIEAKGLDNVLFLGRQSKQDMPRIWSLCDLSVVHLRNSELFRHVIPSKIFESFAMGLPILIGVPEGESTGIVEAQEAGLRCEPEQPAALAEAIAALADDDERLARYRRNGLAAARHYDRRHLASVMLEQLEALLPAARATERLSKPEGLKDGGRP